MDALADEVVQMTYEYRALSLEEPDWVQDDRCHLDVAERAWLAPNHDSGSLNTDWCEVVARRFGHWLNESLRFHTRKRKTLEVGEAEFTAWTRVIKPKLKFLEEELNYEELA